MDSSLMSNTPKLIKAEKILGNNLVFRNARTSDAAFIIKLRTDEKISKFLSQVDESKEKQIAWLEQYTKDDTQAYFIIQDKDGTDIGTVRLYDPRWDSFCWGSWILSPGVRSNCSIESALMVYHYALSLGFCRAHFDVRKENVSVWRFHERFGAKRTDETTLDYFYVLESCVLRHSLERYIRFLPNGISF